MELELSETKVERHLKLKMIHKQLAKIKKEYKIHHKNFKKYKLYHTCCKVSINLLNGVTISSVVLSFSGALPILVVTICSSTASTLLSIISDTIDFQGKMQTSNTSYLQLLDMYNTYRVKCITPRANLDEILLELNAKYGLIYDSALPISDNSAGTDTSQSALRH